MPSDSQSRGKNHKQFPKNYQAIFGNRSKPNPDWHTPKDNELVGWGTENGICWQLRYDAKTGKIKRCNETNLQ